MLSGRKGKNMDREELRNKKIAVVGVGGVGGYLAGMLLREFPNVTLTARGDRAEALSQHGLILHSEYSGESAGIPAAVVDTTELEPQDIIFVCVKNYSLEEACAQLKGAVTENTIVLPVMNGADPGERTRACLEAGTVIDSVIYIVAYAEPDYSIRQEGGYAYLKIGLNNASPREAEQVKEAAEILRLANVDVQISKDIQADIWRKFIFNCAYNVETAFYDNTIGELRADGEKREEFEALLEEAYRVGVGKGIRLTHADVEHMMYRFNEELADSGTSSLQRDIVAGRMSEKEVFGGYIVREAKRLGLEVPVSEKMYYGMKG